MLGEGRYEIEFEDYSIREVDVSDESIPLDGPSGVQQVAASRLS